MAESRVRRGGSDSTQTLIPMPMFAIDTKDGWVLFDTGCDPNVTTDPEGTWGKLARAFKVEMTEEDHQLHRLWSIGVRASDVAHVVVSHLHMDHAGGLRFFPHSRIHVQKAEYRWALHPDRVAGAGFLRSDFDHPQLTYELHEGDAEIVPGVHVVLTDGHTPGHQSLVVDLPRGRVLITGDAAYQRSQIDRLVPPPVTTDDGAAVRSLARIRAFQIRDRATVLVNHDRETWASMRIAPGEEHT
ncbi:MAG TPA: N-acyl homoserine lactonase family protein [Actinomycetes bacterium]|nr:N-acyl homoserine lactonase family protein [Actinomycetes bacterium]